MKKRILSALLIFTMATIIIPIHAETKLPAGYVQMAKSNPKISGDSEYYTHVKYYSEPITMYIKNATANAIKNMEESNGAFEILSVLKKNTKVKVIGELMWDQDEAYIVQTSDGIGIINKSELNETIGGKIKAPENVTLKKRKYGFNVTWKKSKTPNISGYEIQCSPNKNFKGSKVEKIYIQDRNITKKWMVYFEENNYYVRMRSYTGVYSEDEIDLKLKYSKFSKVKKIHISKRHPVKGAEWDNLYLDFNPLEDGSRVVKIVKAYGDEVRQQEERQRTSKIKLETSSQLIVDDSMFSEGEWWRTGDYAPRLYQGGQPIAYDRGNIKWSSSNTKVLKIKKDGKMEPKKEGKVVVTAKYNGKTAKMKVEVIQPNLSKEKWKVDKKKHIVTMTWKNRGYSNMEIYFRNMRVYEQNLSGEYYSYMPSLTGNQETVVLKPGEKVTISFQYSRKGAPSWVSKIDEASIDIPFAYKGHDLKVTGSIENCPESIERD